MCLVNIFQRLPIDGAACRGEIERKYSLAEEKYKNINYERASIITGQDANIKNI